MIVQAVDPQPGEVVLDPAAGTGGFLVEAYERHATAREHGRGVRASSTLDAVRNRGEASPVPPVPDEPPAPRRRVAQIDPLNALRFRMSEIGDRDRVDVIVTESTFRRRGGEGDPAQLPNRPPDVGDSTSLPSAHHAQARRPGHSGSTGGRAGVVVPNGTLSGDGVAARIKEDLIGNFNLHTVVRLPNGVFAPYTPIPTNVLFF